MSVGIIIASHGDFALGVKQTSDMIFGEQEKVEVCILKPEDSLELFREKLDKVLTKFNSDDELLCLVDLWGGTPFNQLNQLKEEETRPIEIVSGLNIPMILRAYSDRFNPNETAASIAKSIMIEGSNGIKTSASNNEELVHKQSNPMDLPISESKMINLGIRHVRLDERLIHGQVATLWLGSLGATRVMIVDDEVVNDPIAKASLKAAVPGGIKLSILKTETAARRIKEDAYHGQKVMLIVKNIKTIFRLIELGVPINKFNLGNSSPKEGTKQVTKSVFLSEEDVHKILELEKDGVVVTAQMVPMEEEKSFSQFYGK